MQDSTVSNIDSVELRNGGSTNLQLVGQVGSKIPVSGGQWEWDIPVDTKSDASCKFCECMHFSCQTVNLCITHRRFGIYK